MPQPLAQDLDGTNPLRPRFSHRDEPKDRPTVPAPELSPTPGLEEVAGGLRAYIFVPRFPGVFADIQDSNWGFWGDVQPPAIGPSGTDPLSGPEFGADLSSRAGGMIRSPCVEPRFWVPL